MHTRIGQPVLVRLEAFSRPIHILMLPECRHLCWIPACQMYTAIQIPTGDIKLQEQIGLLWHVQMVGGIMSAALWCITAAMAGHAGIDHIRR